ncbi:hypothetical protein F4778DRAFT_721261 [Xylariomycetidae sp. FL2044]|nr:hypothetical protein F4778DRAFT_721261 [Xylariomycetidae sp. FL2044]
MQFLTSLFLGLGFIASSMAHPVEKPDVPCALLVFHGGPASYNLSVPLDGSEVKTDQDLSINIIESTDFNALDKCKFTTMNAAAVITTNDPADGSPQKSVEPPTPITSVSCPCP